MKLSSLLIVGALLVSSAVPVLATGRHHHSRGSGVEVDNEANIANVSVALSNTGLNDQSGRGRMTTGYAGSDSWATVDTVNKTTLPRHSRGGLEVDNEANILNVSAAVSNSGLNDQSTGYSSRSRHHHSSGGSTLVTGAAESQSTAEVLNVNVTGF